MAAAIDASTAVQTATATAAQGGLLAAIRVGIGKVEAAGFNPNAVALNPADYAALDVAVMNVANAVPTSQNTFWGMRPVAAGGDPGRQGVRRRLPGRRHPVRPGCHQRVPVRLATPRCSSRTSW